MKRVNKSVLGMIGLGTMGSNLLQNIGDHGYSCSGYDNDSEKVNALNNLNQKNIKGFSDINDFAKNLKKPRTVIMLVPAGKIVDTVIEDLVEVLEKGDIIIDGGNSHFIDTERRYKYLDDKGFLFLGMGVSGGEEGARKGPSLMPGGKREAYEILEPILRKIAAHVNGDPTVANMGVRSAGHFVKMVHNGIEYAIMQLISETYDIFKNSLSMDDAAIHNVFEKWNRGCLHSYLIEITRDIFEYIKTGANHPLLEDIKDQARAKGTGKLASQVAIYLDLSIPVIDVAVSMRNLSEYKDLRTKAFKLYNDSKILKQNEKNTEYIDIVEQAFYFAMISAYAQGMHLLYRANEVYDYKLQLDLIAKVWRGGCIIRSAFLEDVYAAYNEDSNLEHLFLNENIHKKLTENLSGIRKIVSDGALNGIPVPAFSVTLGYFDSFRSEEMPTNLIQAQRDYFGSHTYELIGKKGTFHTRWKDMD